MDATALKRNVGHPPRKVRRVTDTIRGRRVNEALAILKFIPNMPARDVYTTLASAVANAEDLFQVLPESLWVKNARTDEGIKIKRFRARPHGRASKIVRRSCHIYVEVTDDPTSIPHRARSNARRSH